MQLSRDPNLRSVPWRDLLHLSSFEKTYELLLSLPWLLATLYLFHHGWYAGALLASFFFFLTGLRQVHNACHYTLGIPRWACDVVLFVLSVLMLSAMHAIQVTHMHHHRRCLEDDDIEAATAKISGWHALLLGPMHPIRLHYWGFRLGRFDRRCWIVAEEAAIVVALLLVFFVHHNSALQCFAVAMAVGECFTGFFAVWTVHHDCDDAHLARTQRGWLKNLVSYSMFYHLEHHLFPNVPTCHLPQLASRLDRLGPDFASKKVF
jgi:fatty acid desaturase